MNLKLHRCFIPLLFVGYQRHILLKPLITSIFKNTIHFNPYEWMPHLTPGVWVDLAKIGQLEDPTKYSFT